MDKFMLRRLHFSLTSLLILMVSCCLLLGWIGTSVRSNERMRAERRLAKERYAKLGGSVKGWSEVGPSHVLFQGTNFDGAKLKQLNEVLRDHPGLVHVLLYNTDGTDAALSALSRLDTLQELHIRGSTVSDDGLRHIGATDNLRQLSLDGGQFTDVSLRHLESLKQLEWIIIRNSPASPAATERLKDSLSKVRVAAEAASVAD